MGGAVGVAAICDGGVATAAVAFVSGGDPGWPRYDGATRIARVYDATTRDLSDAYASVRPLLAGGS